MLINLVSALVILILLGAGFGAVGARLRRRGRGAVLSFWLITATLLAAAGTARNAAFERGFQFQPAREHPLWMFGLFSSMLLIVLAPASVMLMPDRAEQRSVGANARRGAVLVLPGLMLALVILFALDIGGVHFLPVR